MNHSLLFSATLLTALCPAGLSGLAGDLTAAFGGQLLGSGAPSLRTAYFAAHSSKQGGRFTHSLGIFPHGHSIGPVRLAVNA